MAEASSEGLLIAGGTVVDGTGAAARRADVRVASGRIVEIGPGLRPDGERVIDAGGAYVTPGWIESHTHFDGSMWWDPSCDPMPAYGTTTAVIGNCGLTVAPLRADARSSMIDLFCFIEDLPLGAFTDAVPWDWETWPEYQRAIASRPPALNCAVFVGHQALRTHVMGEEAWERHATTDEIDDMCAVLDEALRHGGIGLSTTFMDTDRTNREVPSRHADDIEFGRLLDVVARHPGATFQFVPRFMQPEFWQDDFDRMAALCGPRGVRANWGALRCEQVRVDEFAERWPHVRSTIEGGSVMAPLFSHAKAYVNLHFDRSIMWHGVPAWHELANGPQADKARHLADAAWRARARTDWDACTYTLAPVRTPDRLLLDHSERGIDGETGLSLVDYAARGGAHLSDALADWLLTNGIGSSLRTADSPLDEAAVCELIRHPHTVTGGSDAGAHIQMFSGAGNATYLFTRYVRDAGLLSIEEAVHAVTGKHARFFGLADRGVLAPG
ncbi:MAG: amidohydrolase family protein, partial [Acidimicrobiales bacterium]|nr:amidohydrolase family protein [Acidimicrobiales bacterium]